MTVPEMIYQAQKADALHSVARGLMEQARDIYAKILAEPTLQDLPNAKMVAMGAENRTLKILALMATPVEPEKPAGSI